MFNKNPAAILSAIAEMVKAVIPMLILFGIIHWTPDQVAAVMFVAGIAVTSITTILTRSQVTPNDQVNALIEQAIKMPVGTPVETVKSIQAAKDAK